MSFEQIPNGGFLASWGDGGGFGDASSGGDLPGSEVKNTGPSNAGTADYSHSFMGGNPASFQTAGGSGGGFTNFASWLAANPSMGPGQVAGTSPAPRVAVDRTNVAPGQGSGGPPVNPKLSGGING